MQPLGKSMICHRFDTGTAASHAASCVVSMIRTVVLQSCKFRMSTCSETCRCGPACDVSGCSSVWTPHHTSHTWMDEHLHHTQAMPCQSLSYNLQPHSKPPAPCGLLGLRIDPLHFLAWCRKGWLNQALSVLSLSLGFFWYMCYAVN